MPASGADGVLKKVLVGLIGETGLTGLPNWSDWF
jgi:hypothetical protein